MEEKVYGLRLLRTFSENFTQKTENFIKRKKKIANFANTCARPEAESQVANWTQQCSATRNLTNQLRLVMNQACR